MKTFFPKSLFALIAFIPFLSLANPVDTLIIVKGNAVDGKFSQILIGSYNPDYGDPSQNQLMAEAWTCDYIGHPTCNYRALFKFDLTDIPESSIVDSVKLFLFAQTNNVEGLPGSPTYGDDNASLLRKILEPWDLLNTGWDNQPLVSYPDQKVLEQSTSPVQNYVIDITDFASDWIAHPENNNGMLMRLQKEDFYNSMIFNSGKAVDSLKPTLKIYVKKGALPVLIKNFSGNLVNGNVNLNWSVLDGTTLANIIVERSYDSRSFNSFVTIPAKDVTTEIKYTTTDYKVAAPDGKVYYRLKLVNKDGSYKYSSVLLIHLLQNSTDVLLMPNPVKENFQLIFTAQSNSKSDFKVLNSLGQSVDKFTYQIEVGNNSITVIPSKNLAPGLYIVQFTLDGHIITKRFLKQ
ncbi:MAG: DNRLRE domain-containing protein [Chitinophagaceae bacterium]